MTYVPGGGSGGSSNISTSGDVALNNPTTQDVLSYDASLQKWVNVTMANAVVSTSNTVRPTNGGVCLFTGTDPGSSAVEGDLWVETAAAGTKPVTPPNLAGTTLSDSQIRWTWNVSSGATEYLLRFNSGTPLAVTGNSGELLGLPNGTLWYDQIGLPAGSTQKAEVAARNSYGTSAFSVVVSRATSSSSSTPSIPSSVAASKDDIAGTATLSWQAPTSDGGSAITGYFVGRDGTDAGGYGSWSTIVSPTTLSQTFQKLVNGSTYNLTVYAINASGNGASVVKTITMGSTADKPSVPISVTSVKDDTAKTATLSWQAPTSDGGSAITGYFVGRDGTDSTGTGPWSTTVASSTRSYTFGSLKDGVTYNLTVYAVNANGNGAAAMSSVTMSGTVTPGSDDAPASPTVSGGLAGTWTTIFHDDFDGTSIDTTKWNFKDAFHSAPGWHQDAAWVPVPATNRQVEVHDGQVDIKIRKKLANETLPGGKQWTTGWLATGRPDQTYPGSPKFVLPANSTTFTEARLWNPNNKGSLTGFWLFGDTYASDPHLTTGGNTNHAHDHPGGPDWYNHKHSGWSVGGEVDILEFCNNATEHSAPMASCHFPIDYYTEPPGTHLYNTHTTHPNSFTKRPELNNSWHTWGLYRSPTKMEVYIDGVKLNEWLPGVAYPRWPGADSPGDKMPLPDVLFKFPQMICLSFSIGGGWARQGLTESEWQEGTYSAKYVKVWQLN